MGGNADQFPFACRGALCEVCEEFLRHNGIASAIASARGVPSGRRGRDARFLPGDGAGSEIVRAVREVPSFTSGCRGRADADTAVLCRADLFGCARGARGAGCGIPAYGARVCGPDAGVWESRAGLCASRKAGRGISLCRSVSQDGTPACRTV